MGGITGWDRGLGMLLGLWLRDQAQKKKEETLRQLLEEQRRQLTTSQIGNGLQQGPVEPPGVRTPEPAPQQGFLQGLLNVPGDILQGATGGPPQLPVLQEQYLTGAEDLKRQKTLADQIKLYQQTKANQPPKLDEQMLGVIAQTQGPQAALNIWQQHYANPLGIGNVAAQALQNMPGGPEAYAKKLTTPEPGPQPRAPTRLEQLQKLLTPEQFQQVLANESAPKPPPSPVPVNTGAGTLFVNPRETPAGTFIPTERTVPAGELDKISALQSLQDEVQYLRDQFVATQGAYVGPVRGRVGALGATAGVLGAEESGFIRAAGNITDQLNRMRSGGQISPQEYERLIKLTPNPGTGAEQFMGNLVDFQRELTNTQKNKVDTLKAAGYRIGGQDLSKSAGIVGHPSGPPAAAPTVGAPAAATGQGARYRITSGALKGTVIDNVDTLKQLRAAGILKGNEQIEEGH